MKRKPAAKPDPAVPEPIIAPEILAPEIVIDTRRPLTRVAKPVQAKCVVCGSECTASAAEQLCWVCRRLKISAWRESEQQAAVQE